MSEHPILFSSEMVRAILQGRKTQTRRVLEMRSKKLLEAGYPKQPLDVLPMPNSKNPNGREWVTLSKRSPEGNKGLVIGCRYGEPGDCLWVRETFRELIDLGAGTNSSSNYVEYKADGLQNFNPDVKWKPSIFMPRWASRITLEIVNVRVERVQEISENDARAEGIELEGLDHLMIESVRKGLVKGNLAIDRFARLWRTINTEKGKRWEDNPWVWVIEFKVVGEKCFTPDAA